MVCHNLEKRTTVKVFMNNVNIVPQGLRRLRFSFFLFNCQRTDFTPFWVVRNHPIKIAFALLVEKRPLPLLRVVPLFG